VVNADRTELALAAERGRRLIEESRESVIVLDADRRVVAASRRARQECEGLEEGAPVPAELLQPRDGRPPVLVPYKVDGRRESLLYVSSPEQLGAYEELRSGFTASVSHELRTPLARLLALLETALLPGAELEELVEQARLEIDQVRELIDDVLFLAELETGRAVLGLGSTPALPMVREAAAERAESALRAGVSVEVEGDEDVEVPLRPRILKVIAENLIENAIRYAGDGATFRLTVRREGDAVALTAADDGAGVDETELLRLFERFYRADQARASRGTGLGLAIVKHVVTSAGGTVEASGALDRGLQIRCLFPTPR
jgi:signal transduction histidine kinase